MSRWAWAVVDSFAWVVAIIAADLLRFDFQGQALARIHNVWLYVAAAALQVVLGATIGPYAVGHIRGSFEETQALVKTTGLTGLGLTWEVLGPNLTRAPRNVPIMALAMIMMFSARSVIRSWRTHQSAGAKAGAERAIIFGARENADVVIAGNDDLAEWASLHHRDVPVIPSRLEPTDYELKTDWALAARPTIVWLGSPSTEGHVAQIAPALAKVCELTGARAVLISGAVDNPALASVAPWVKRVPLVPAIVRGNLAAADVAIAPLDASAYARGKCAHKLLQYAATGLPVVGSPTGANAFALARFDGVAVRSQQEWVDGLVQVLGEPAEHRAARGNTALRAVAEHYSFEAWAPAGRSATRLSRIGRLT